MATIDSTGRTKGNLSVAIGQHKVLAERCEAISQYIIVLIGSIVAAYGIYYMATNAVGCQEFNMGLILLGAGSAATLISLLIVNFISSMRGKTPAAEYCFSFNVRFSAPPSPQAHAASFLPKPPVTPGPAAPLPAQPLPPPPPVVNSAAPQTAASPAVEVKPVPVPIASPAPVVNEAAPEAAASPPAVPVQVEEPIPGVKRQLLPSQLERVNSLQLAQNDAAARAIILTFLPTNRCNHEGNTTRLHVQEARFPQVMLALIQEYRESNPQVAKTLLSDLFPHLGIDKNVISFCIERIQQGDVALFSRLSNEQKMALFVGLDVPKGVELLRCLVTSEQITQDDKIFMIQQAPKPVLRGFVLSLFPAKETDLVLFCSFSQEVQQTLLASLDEETRKTTLMDLLFARPLSKNASQAILGAVSGPVRNALFSEKLRAFDWNVLRLFKLLTVQVKKEMLSQMGAHTVSIVQALARTKVVVVNDKELLKVTSPEIIATVIAEEIRSGDVANADDLLSTYCECISQPEKIVFFEVVAKTLSDPAAKKALFKQLAIRETRWPHLAFDWEFSTSQFLDVVTAANPEREEKMFWHFFSNLSVEKMKLVLNKLKGPHFQKFVNILVMQTTPRDPTGSNRPLVLAFEGYRLEFAKAVAETLNVVIGRLSKDNLQGIKNLCAVTYLNAAFKTMPAPMKQACEVEIKRVLGAHTGFGLLQTELNK